MRYLSCLIILMIGAITIFAQSPHGDKLKIDCANCHESSNWKIIPKQIKFDHNTETTFKLMGQHSTVSCQSCHQSLVFSDVKTECISCHRDVHQNSLGPDCAKCHTPSTWLVTNIIQIHKNSRFPLVGVHLNVNCASCHKDYAKLYFSPQNTTCFSCHSAQYYATTAPNHVQSNISTNCQDCHSMTSFSWIASNMQNFDHSFFPLTAGHNIQNCFSCHIQGRSDFKGISTDCYSCHKQNYMLAKNPDHMQAKFSTTCSDCHTTTSFTTAAFNHNNTGFPLTGVHANLQCAQCHASGYTNTPTACVSCHLKDYNAATSPVNHTAAGLPQTCGDCHGTTAPFTTSTFNHTTVGFTLTGAHTTVACENCHKGTVVGTPTDCYSCHTADFASTTSPSHTAQNFSHDCTQCHSTTNWNGATFNHSTTGFPLTGVHANLNCAQCHASGYTNTSPSCVACHLKDYNAAVSPVNHIAAGLPQTCSDCHGTTAPFTTSTFNHTTVGFMLTGAHTTVACENCHKGTVVGTPTDCYSCHVNDYNSTTNPPHATQGFPHDCTQCHSTTNWTSATFDHSTTGFALTGAHSTVQCAQCHASGYTNTPTACYACHQADYQKAVTPVNHVAAGLPQTCGDCHNTTAFTATTFNHTTVGFTLTGAHTTVACENCHKGTVVGTPTDCYSCHSADYSGTTNPPHAIQGFPHNCIQCHSTTNWSGATFDHSTTGFALTGAHSTVQCAQCHASGYTNTPTACYACHQADYQKATSPVNHVAAGLPQTCGDCHNTTAFTATTFNHTTVGFALTGAHTTVACENCHKGTVVGTPTDCYSCHINDYNGTTDPPHAAQGFPHNCTQCHSTTNWSGATFDHSTTGFALTGAHTTVQCASCHTSGYTTAPSTACYACHQSNYQTATSPVNHVAAGLPQTCGDCHNTTAFTATTFNHTTVGFALTGAHTTVACENCHKGTVVGTPTDCYSCHVNDYNSTTDPPHAAQGFPHNCTQCHSMTNWSGATFDHSTTGFALTGAHTTVQCASCHTSGYTTAPPTACYGCHATDYNTTTNPPHQAAGYPTDCTQCHTTTTFTTSTFNHTTYFPLTNNHNVSCGTCHTTISNFAIFSCTATCHSAASTNSNHSGVKNYVYSPTSCYGCHPTGRGG